MLLGRIDQLVEVASVKIANAIRASRVVPGTIARVRAHADDVPFFLARRPPRLPVQPVREVGARASAETRDRDKL